MKRFLAIYALIWVGFVSADWPKTVSSIVQFVTQYPEEVLPDSQNWLDPEFELFYDTLFLKPTRRNFLFSLGFDTAPFSEKELRTALLEYAVAQAPAEEHGSYIFMKQSLCKGDHIYVIGDLHGAMHSFARLLLAWSREGIIRDDLSVISPNTYFVFLGDYINRSPYGFFLLPLLLAFSEKNPGKVILLRGRQERERYWEQFLTSRSFLKRLYTDYRWSQTEDILPLSQEINRFFGQLYDGIVYRHSDVEENIIISHHMFPKEYEAKRTVISFVQGEHRHFRAIFSRGLQFDQFLTGSATWNIFSAPIPAYSRLNLLARDSYALITVDKTFSASTIAGLERNIAPLEKNVPTSRIFLPEKDRWAYSLAYGCSFEDDNFIEILRAGKPFFICSSGDISGGLRGMGKGLKEGMEACFLRANQERSLPNTFFRVVSLDDGYVPEQMEENVHHCMREYDVDSILLAMGSPTVMQILPLVKEGKLALFFPATGIPVLRNAEFSHMIHMRHSYADEVYPLLVRIRELYGARRFAFIYQNDFFGRPLMESSVAFLREQYPECAIETLGLLRGQAVRLEDLNRIREFGPDVIGLFVSTQLQLNSFVNILGLSFLLGKHLFAIDFSTDIFYDFASRWGVKILQSSSFQSPDGAYGLFMNTYRSAMNHYRYPLSRASVEAFTASALLLAALQKSYPDMNAKRVMKELEQLDVSAVLGYTAPLNLTKRSFEGPVWVNDKGVLLKVTAQENTFSFISYEG